ncbi:vacuolar sorting protein 39 domain 2-domain-containing protein [Lobosporangium transversale]|uniref:Vacuolar sorting protein 39 domain 2-domain-containing protein n=1 Tax=Lobosporangium transversale TaxID=64571 RepID=A0A1Y2GKM7_9FUNG|nr:vacuolar sorting protein 39 domain 2-domain-containing protein [Lobosporangium transversale]ORZ12536.1 vacuolar sorting protein 39 domain 2-domain-containing protein [Lobosporangium transversale]|eukprot:XP_021880155.1 vacuolar sorting protein 39 domain 2-domain-containing protein [Lobosporangium transversale]
MFTTYTVQPLLRGVHLDDISATGTSSLSRSFLDRPSHGGQAGGGSSPVSKSSGIFNRNTRPLIESIDNFENHLYLGTSDGILLHYTIDEQISSESDLPRSRLVQRKTLGFGKKVVERIMVISCLRMAIVLCDSAMTFYSLPGFSPFAHQVLPPIKGVTAFCDDSSQRGQLAEDGSVRLCITKRRTIQFYSLWSDAISEPRELNLPNGALVVTRWRNIVCVADSNDFNLIDIRVGRMIPVLPVVQNGPGSSAQVLKPVCLPIAENEFLLASATSSGQTAIGIFCSGSGDPVRGTLQWSSYPRALAVEFPYVTALLRGNIIEIHNILDQKLVQSIRLDPSIELRTLMQGPGITVWMSTLAKVLTLLTGSQDTQQGVGIDQKQQDTNRLPNVLARILIAGKDSVSALVTTPLVLHADMLLQQGRVEEALLLSEKTIATISSENLHRERLQMELDYIHQKSGLIYLGETLFDDAFGLFQRGRMDPRVLISIFPDVLQRVDLMSQVSLFRGIRDQIERLRTLPDIINNLAKAGSEQSEEFGKVLLGNAKEVFLQYLTRYRKEGIARKNRPLPQAEATDTALLGLWVDSGDDASLIQLLNSNNLCIPDLCEQKLKDNGKHYALSIWYKSRKDYKMTLSLWKSLFLGEVKDNSFDMGLQDMATLLQSLQDISLVEEYGWWVVEQDESIGLKIFMPGETKRAALFDPDQVLAKCKSKISNEGLLTYMEYVVIQRKSESSEHHEMLIQMYVDNIKRLTEDMNTLSRHNEVVLEFTNLQKRYLLGLDGSRKSSDTTTKAAPVLSYSSTFAAFLHSHAKSDLVCSYRSKLSLLLQLSVHYTASTVLPQVEAVSHLKFEKAILLARLACYEECIKIMVKDISDYQGTEIFCLNAGVFRSPRRTSRGLASEGSQPKESTAEIEKKKQLFMILLQEYLHLAQDQGMVALALSLLDSQSSYLDIAEVIHMLPPVWSVELLQRYLVRSLRRSYHEFKEIQVVKGLSLGENLRISEELYQLYEAQGPVIITADDICHVCGTAVADTVFMRTVDMKVVHLHCGSLQSSS